ncbi:MAG: sirohydrochlorin cobaltochelatase [Candidatus Omnitrophica bacterium]|nr:sirohydrochlorin cobaltochelatase [Candidatus Omnitrophota bacterium]
MVNRINRHCSYFPCHAGLEDCTFCYCPFYPCKDTQSGKFIYTKTNNKVWSCEDCGWIHKKKVVDGIFRMIRAGNIKARPALEERKFEKTGVIILGHGSKLKNANDVVRKVARHIMKSVKGLLAVEPAYLQLHQPDLRKTIEGIVKAGCKKIIIVPFFLFMGNHVTRDIPRIIREESKAHKDIKFVYAKNIGQDPRIKSMVMDCVKEAAG